MTTPRFYKRPAQRRWRNGLAALALATGLASVPPPMGLMSGSAWAQATSNAEKDAFNAAKELGTAEGWEAFLAHYPNGFNADLARAYVKKLSEAAPANAPPPQANQPASAPADTNFPIEAGSWGGIVRKGPGRGFAKQDSLAEGDPVALMGVSPELDNGYPWFKIWYGKDQRKGYMWGGILCAKGTPRADVHQMCPGTEAAKPSSVCARTGNAAEQTICADRNLTQLDAKLNDEFNLAVSNITSEAVGGTEADVKKFRQEQRDWLVQRDRCGADAKCLTSIYKERLEFFEEYNQPE